MLRKRCKLPPAMQLTHGHVGLLALLLSAVSAWSTPPTHARVPADAPQSELGQLELQVVDESGRPIAARARLVARSFGERLRLGREGEVQLIASEQGGRVLLTAGDYELLVSRGPEWSIARRPLHIDARETAHVKTTLEHEVTLPGFSGADLHVHTERSDDAHAHAGGRGVNSLALRAEGVALAAVTDHNRIGDMGGGIDSVAGAEITTWEPEIGHFNAFPLKRVPRWRGTKPSTLFAALARDPDVFVQINHPRLEHHISYFELGGFNGEGFDHTDFGLGVDGLEVWNGYDIASASNVQRLLAEWRGLAAHGRHLTATGGSDCHGAAGHLPGYPRTYVGASTAAQLAPALKAGRAFVTNGPLLSLSVQGEGPGATVSPAQDGSVEVELRVLAASWMQVDEVELWAGEDLAWHAQLPRAAAGSALRYSVRVRLDMAGARSLQAVAHGGRGLDVLLDRTDVEPLAFTNTVRITPLGSRTYAQR